MSVREKQKWAELKADLETGLRDGLVTFRKGAMIVRKRTGESAAGRTDRYKLIALKTKVHNGICNLGARVYALAATAGQRNPARDARVKDITAQLKRYEAKIVLLEKTLRKSSKRRTEKTV